jgi:hypothetical protein
MVLLTLQVSENQFNQNIHLGNPETPFDEITETQFIFVMRYVLIYKAKKAREE